MQLISKFNKGICFLFCVIDIFSKYAWVIILLKDKKSITISNAFQKTSGESNRRLAKSKGRKLNKTWVGKGSEFYKRSLKSRLEKNDIKMYSTHNEGKSFVAERFVRIIKNKIYKYMTSISKNVYIDKLDDVVNKYNKMYHCSIKMKPVDVKPSTHINSSKEINDKDPKFKIGDIAEYQYMKIFLQKPVFQIGLKKFL